MNIKSFIIDRIKVGNNLLVPVYARDGYMYVRLSDMPKSMASEFGKYLGANIAQCPAPPWEKARDCAYPQDFTSFSGGSYVGIIADRLRKSLQKRYEEYKKK